MNAQHLTTDELADAAEGLLDPARAAFAESHLAGCPDCHAQSDALRAVTATLQAEPPWSMPEAVAHRLNDVVAAQQVQRADASVMGSGLESVGSRRRATLGTFGEDLEKARPRWALGALAAAVVAAVVGFSTYVISASAGLNEPPVVAAVTSRDLGADARAGASQWRPEPAPFLPGLGLCPQGHRRPYHGACCQQSGRHTSTTGLHRVRWVDAGDRGDGLRSRYALGGPVRAAAALRVAFKARDCSFLRTKP